MTEPELKSLLASRLVYFRKLNKLTQLELAARINYSDKSVSKWERGEGLPDIYVLSTLAELYGVTVNDFITEDAPPPELPKKLPLRDRILIPAMAVGLVWLAACVVFAALRLFAPNIERAWLCFIYALPASCVVATVFMKLWWNLLSRLLATSALIWMIALSIFMSMRMRSIGLVFLIAGVMQLLTVLWFLRQFNPRNIVRRNEKRHDNRGV